MTEFTELSPEEEIILEKNLVWIFASPRSGTTWTSVQLLKYKTKLFGEPLIGSHLADARELGDTFIRRFEEHGNRKQYFFCNEYKPVWQYYLRKLILNRIHAQFQDLASTIIIKEPNGSMAADMISQCFPNSKIIILIRDGRDVLNSIITALSEGGYAQKKSEGAFKPLSGQRRKNRLVLSAREWAKLVEILCDTFDNHASNLKFWLRYEDLLDDTFSEVKKLYNFLEIPIDNKKLNQIITNSSVENISEDKKGLGTTIQFAKSGVWKERFDQEEKQMIENIMGDSLRKINYL